MTKLNSTSITEQCYQYILDNKIERLNIYDFLDHIRPQYDVSDEEFSTIMSYFYTDLNLDGRFVCVEDGTWALKDNLSVENVLNFVEPSISTYSLEDEEYDEELESDEEDVEDELDSHVAAEDADDDSEDDLYGFEESSDITSKLGISSEEEEF